MKKSFLNLVAIITIICTGGMMADLYSQEAPRFNCALPAEIADEQPIQIYIFSSPGCGYSRRAFKDLGQWAAGKPVTLIALNVSDNLDRIKSTKELMSLYAKYDIHLSDASACDDRYKNLIPQIFVFNNESDKPLLTIKGWASSDLKRVEKKVQKYL